MPTPIEKNRPENLTQETLQNGQAEYAPMDDEKRAFLAATKKMYDIQEFDPRFEETGQITTDLPGLPHFIIKKLVYSPEHVPVAMAWPKWIAERSEGKSFLEIGTGTGIAAVYVGLHGKPKQVIATDISPMAVENCRANAEQYGLEEPFFRTIESDVFEAVPQDEKFDTMFWNFPWNAPDQDIEDILAQEGSEVKPEKVIQLKAGLDPQYKALRRFIREGKQHLNPGGEILLGAGAPVRHDIIFGEAEKYGYNIEVAAEQEMDVDIVDMPKLKVILYKLSPKTTD